MQFESGNLVPSIERYNFLPFAITENVDECYNISGFSGPINYNGPTIPTRMFSGVAGNGSFYPGSGTLEQLVRLFWGVKAWTLQITSSSLNSQQVSCNGLPITLNYEIGGFITKTLILQDYWSYVAKTGEFSPLVDPGVGSVATFPNRGTCVPVDPIQKYEDLFCRKKYFCWMPDTESIAQFVPRTQGLFTGVRTPYSERFDIFRRASFETNCYPSTFVGVQSMFGLSIMNPDFLVYSGMNRQTGSGWYEPLNIDSGNYNNFLGSRWESGNILTNRWGEITGFGHYLSASGNVPNVLYKEHIDINNASDEEKEKYIPEFNPEFPNNYFPLIYFYMKVANNESVTSTYNFPVNEYISTLAPTPSAKRVGTFKIYDNNIGVNNTTTGVAAKTIFQCPLYGSSVNPMLNADVVLNPTSFWLTNSGENNY